MSRKATSEYIGARRRAYAQADREKRSRILDDVCETTGYERKYANRLPPGSRKFREHKGRGKTYGEEVRGVLGDVWREAGCPCLPYFKAEVGRWIEEYSSEVAHVRPEAKALLGDLVKLCDDWSDFRNFFCPCKMLVSKEKRGDGKGYRCRYDSPRTPFQRVVDEHVLSSEQEAALRSYMSGLIGMELYRRVRKRLRKIRRMQEAHDAAKRSGRAASSAHKPPRKPQRPKGC